MADFSNKVIYQIYPKSFKDSNGDGIGDLRGVAEKLDYLKDLGVDYLWLTPFFVSPQRDNGYDVADYRNIDPMFGTMEDLDNLIAEGEKRNIGLMFDMVFNHTSTSHEWFRRALAGEKKYQDYYIFKEGAPDQPPTNWQSKFGGSAWEYVSSLGKWYLHLFDVTQADLNWKNPEVREELKEVIRFWKAKGVKGFRFDVVNLISKPEIWEDDFEGDGRKFYTDGPYVHEYLKELVRDTGIEDYVTVKKQKQDRDSILEFYKKLIMLRKEKEVIARGNIEFMEVENAGVLAYTRCLDKQKLLVCCNFRDVESQMEFTQEWKSGRKILGNYEENHKNNYKVLTLRPYEIIVLEKGEE